MSRRAGEEQPPPGWIRTAAGQVVPEPPLDAPIGPPPGPHRRPAPVAPAPRWVAPTFGLFAVVLLPWIVFLGETLPARNTSPHYNLAWVGFDCGLFAALALTAWFAYRRSTWVEVSATAAATLLACDAWFDTTTSRGGMDLVVAVVQAVGIELPLAGLSLWIARHAEQVSERTTAYLLRRSARQAERIRRDEQRLRRAGRDPVR